MCNPPIGTFWPSCLVFVSICSEHIIVSGVVIFYTFWKNRVALKRDYGALPRYTGWLLRRLLWSRCGRCCTMRWRLSLLDETSGNGTIANPPALRGCPGWALSASVETLHCSATHSLAHSFNLTDALIHPLHHSLLLSLNSLLLQSLFLSSWNLSF